MKINGYTGIELSSVCNIKESQNAWREAMFTANGEMGIIGGLEPCDDTVIFNNTKCVMDTVNPMETAELFPIDFEMKKAAINRVNTDIWVDYLKNHWFEKYKIQDYVACPARPYFPAALLKIQSGGKVENYVRGTDFYTAEIYCRCTVDGAEFKRREFVSREDGIAVIMTECAEKRDFNLYFEDFGDMFSDGETDKRKLDSIKFPQTEKRYAQNGELAFYGKPPISHIGDIPENPVTGLSHSGFWTAVKALTDGEITADEDSIKIRSATNLILLVKTDYDRRGMESIKDVEKCCKNTFRYLGAIARGYKNGNLYAKLLSKHVKLHSALMRSAGVNLSGGSGVADVDKIRLAQKRADDGKVNADWLDLLYVHSRFVSVCSHGYSTARLGGIWIGNLLPAWSGDHTLNANTNAQICGLNTGNLPECTESYINFLLDFAPDWLENAKNIHGIDNAIKAPARTDGAGCGLFFSTPAGFPMVYWNAGAAWQLLPVFEMWECYGNRKIKLRKDLDIKRLKPLLDLSYGRADEVERERTLDLESEILKPMITKLMNFWLGFADERFYTDGNGKVHAGDGTKIGADGKYILAPAYSPENAPDEVKSAPVCANAAIDIAAARDSVRMLKKLVARGIITDYDMGAVELFESRLPGYMTESDGALKEWSLEYTKNRNNHRHSSHLYAAWPAYEAARDNKIADAVKQAVKDRRTYQSEQRTTGFGRMQLAMASARIGNKLLFEKCLYDLTGADFEYASLMTGHDMGKAPRSFCQDNAASIHGVVNEALIYSDDKGIVLLPAGIWQKGEARGLVTRLGVRVNVMKWKNGRVSAKLEALQKDISVRIEYCGLEKTVNLVKGAPQTVSF